MSHTKEFILKAAFGLFLQKSYKEVTMKEIVEKTGLSKGAFYHYFTSKEQLFYEVIDAFYFKALVVDFKKFSKDSLIDFYRQYANDIQEGFRYLKENLLPSDTSVHINFITILFDATNLFPEFRIKLMKSLKEELEAWTEVVKLARSRGEFTSPMTDEQIARMFIYSNDGISFRLLLEGKMDLMHSEMITLWDNFYEEIKN
ncbi:MAG: TetR/AcrR family transcriptional regulator [Melioribacteraceae bacterium]|nr:TetR/AcrR family transcriptional regulator [Melioribacteraceae bacterium]